MIRRSFGGLRSDRTRHVALAFLHWRSQRGGQSSTLPPVGPERPFAPAAASRARAAERLARRHHASWRRAEGDGDTDDSIGLAVDPAEQGGPGAVCRRSGAGRHRVAIERADQARGVRDWREPERHRRPGCRRRSRFAVSTTTLPQMLAMRGRRRAQPDVSAGRARFDEGHDRAAAAGAGGIAAIREQQAVPADAVRRSPVRAHRRHAGIVAGDRSRVRSSRIHQTYYRPNNAFLVVVGDVAPDAVFEAAEKAFGGWERRALPETKADRNCRR